MSSLAEAGHNEIITEKLKTSEGKDFLNKVRNLKTEDDPLDIVFDTNIVIGFGYQVPKGSTGLNKVKNLNKIKVVMTVGENNQLFVLTTYPVS